MLLQLDIQATSSFRAVFVAELQGVSGIMGILNLNGVEVAGQRDGWFG
jgi:hypothetical protein